MKINLSCSTNDKEEVFYYHRNTLACLNCSDNTRMKGNTVVINDINKQISIIEDNIRNGIDVNDNNIKNVFNEHIDNDKKGVALNYSKDYGYYTEDLLNNIRNQLLDEYSYNKQVVDESFKDNPIYALLKIMVYTTIRAYLETVTSSE